MFSTTYNLNIPKFTGSYKNRKDAVKASTDENKAVKQLQYGRDTFYINNDASGRDLDQYVDLTKYMPFTTTHKDTEGYDYRYDGGHEALDMNLIAGKEAYLYSQAK